MRNTLKFETLEELTIALESYNSFICEIPDHFTVLDEYLYGLTVDEFCASFKKLETIISAIYDEIIKNPQEIGLVKANKKTGELKPQMQHQISCVKKFLYTIGHFSTLESDSLIIRMDHFMEAYMTYYFNYSIALTDTIKQHDSDKQNKFFKEKYIHAVFGLYKKFGFEIKGLNDEYEKNSNIIISYPSHPSIIKVIKAFAMPRICKIGFGFDFTKFNYRVFSYDNTAKLPVKDLYTFQLLATDEKNFLLCLDESLAEIGVSRNEYQHEGYSTYLYGNVRFRVTQDNENKLHPSIPLIVGKTPEQTHRKIPKIEKYIESLPEKYLNAIGECRSCQGAKTTECWRRFKVSTKDKNYFICNNAWWVFPAELDAISHIIKAYHV